MVVVLILKVNQPLRTIRLYVRILLHNYCGLDAQLLAQLCERGALSKLGRRRSLPAAAQHRDRFLNLLCGHSFDLLGLFQLLTSISSSCLLLIVFLFAFPQLLLLLYLL